MLGNRRDDRNVVLGIARIQEGVETSSPWGDLPCRNNHIFLYPFLHMNESPPSYIYAPGTRNTLKSRLPSEQRVSQHPIMELSANNIINIMMSAIMPYAVLQVKRAYNKNFTTALCKIIGSGQAKSAQTHTLTLYSEQAGHKDHNILLFKECLKKEQLFVWRTKERTKSCFDICSRHWDFN